MFLDSFFFFFFAFALVEDITQLGLAFALSRVYTWGQNMS